MNRIEKPEDLQRKSVELKIEVIKMLDKAGSGHVAGAFSAADALTTLYYNKMKINPADPDWEDRDYFLMSNGHICPIWYAILGDLGYFPKEELDHLREIGHMLQGHPVVTIPGVENSSGPLGHGLSQAVGIAVGLKREGKKNKVFCLTSDGEHDEGQLYEAAMSAGKWKLDNLTVIVDRNGIQIEGDTDEIMPLGDIRERYEALNWLVLEVNGNNYEQILAALDIADRSDIPTAIISHTVAGEEVSYMEGKWKYHDWKGEEGDAEKAIADLEALLG